MAGVRTTGQNDALISKSEMAWRTAQDAFEAGNIREARRQAFIAADKGMPIARMKLLLAATAWYQGRRRDAQEILDNALACGQVGPEAYYYIANNYRLQGNLKAALENYRLVLKGSQDILYRALTLREIEQMHMLENLQFSRLVALCSREIDSEDSYATLSERRGYAILAMLRGDTHGAFIRLRNLQRDWPDTAEIYRDFAMLHIRDGEWLRAIIDLKKGCRLYPGDYEMHVELARCLHRVGRLEEALAVLRSMKGDALLNPAIFVNMGNIHIRQGRSVGAIRAFRKALELRDDYIPALFNLGTVYHQAGSLDLAEQYYRRILTIESHHAWAMYNLALLYYESGDYATAVRMLKRCHDDNPGFEPAMRNLRFINLARVCFPNEGPEELKTRTEHAWWIGAASLGIVVIFSILKGWV